MPELIRNGDQGLQDFTQLMELVERDENQLEKLGLFNKDFTTAETVSFERKIQGEDAMYAVARGADRQLIGDDTAITAFFGMPFFTNDKVVKPKEIDFLRMFGTAAAPETLTNKVEGIIRRVQKNHAKLHKKVMYAALKGSTYAVDKAGANVVKYTKTFQTMFEVLDPEMFNATAGGAKTYALSDQTKNPADEFELYRQHIVAAAKDEGDNYQLMIILGSTAFTLLKNHADYVDAFSQFASSENPLRERLGGLSNGRILEWQGLVFLEDTSGEIGTSEGYGLPMGMDIFELMYGKADTLEEIELSESYLFLDVDRRKATVESEVSMVAVVKRPELIAHWTFT